ncbi:hypothetical protein ACIRP0_36420 [Streptomyces sp. NPDC101733]|uniref:hypothetical protein n=1 Tax=unclassified Streptomyces TaxID=2593676 RepID=UPI003824979A
MTLKEGLRVRLAADVRLTAWAALTEDAAAEPSHGLAGSLSLAAGTEGTVERVVEHRIPGEGVREYERLKSLLDSFGEQMPTASGKQLREKVAALEPEWTAYQREGARVRVRVRFDNGFVLDDAHEDLFTRA